MRLAAAKDPLKDTLGGESPVRCPWRGVRRRIVFIDDEVVEFMLVLEKVLS